MKAALIGFLQALALVGVLLFILWLAGCATAKPDPGVCIAPEVMRQCAVEGGCTLFSRARLEQLVEEVAAAACRGKV